MDDKEGRGKVGGKGKRPQGQVKGLHRFLSREQVASMTMRYTASPMATVSLPCLLGSESAEVVEPGEVKMTRGQI